MAWPARPTAESSSLNVRQFSNTSSASAANSSELEYLRAAAAAQRPPGTPPGTPPRPRQGPPGAAHPPRSSRERMVAKSMGFLMTRR